MSWFTVKECLRMALIAVVIGAVVGSIGYAISLCHISGHATFEVSFNQPLKTVEQAAVEQLGIALPDIALKPARKK